MMGGEDYLSLAADWRMCRAAEECMDPMGILRLRDWKITEISGGVQWRPSRELIFALFSEVRGGWLGWFTLQAQLRKTAPSRA